jgi:chromate transport protein ChrA
MQESGRWLELLLYFLRLGLLGFGGPVALVGQMEREVVAERGVASLAALFRWKVNNPLLIAATAVIGLLAYPILQPDWVMVK